MLETMAISCEGRVQTATLPVLRRSVFALGSLALLERPLVAVIGARSPSPVSARLARRAARTLARAGLVVAALAQTAFGRTTLTAAAAAGAPVVGMLHASFGEGFTPPAAIPPGFALWLSLFGPGGWVREGPDASDRVLGALVSAVVVVDTGGLPDAFYVAESALRSGRPVLFPRGAAACWPTSPDRPGVRTGSSPAAILRMLAALPAAVPSAADTAGT